MNFSSSMYVILITIPTSFSHVHSINTRTGLFLQQIDKQILRTWLVDFLLTRVQIKKDQPK